MKITNQLVQKHGLKIDEYENIKKLLKENQICWNLEFFQQCGMSIVLINLHEFT